MAKKLFGEIALEKKLVTTDKLYHALTVQAKAEVEGRAYRSLGEILIEMGFMTEKQVLEVLKVLHHGGDAQAGSPTKKREARKKTS